MDMVKKYADWLKDRVSERTSWDGAVICAVCLIIIFASILINMIAHLVTLEVELDASFKRAMPILEKKIPQEYHSACKSILKVCAFTYVIGSLTSILDVRKVWFLLRAFLFRR